MSRGLTTLFSFDYPPLSGGIARLCSELAAGLARRGMSVGVLSQGAPSSAPAGQAGPVSETRVTRLRPFREMAAFRRMRALRGGGPVICGLWYPEGLIAALAGSKPLVILAHGSELLPAPLWRRCIWRRLLRWTLSRADIIVANSSYTRGLIEKASPGCRAVAVPLAVDHGRFAPEGRAGAKAKLGVEGKLVLSTVSRLRAYKGHGTVFRALAMLPEAVRGKFAYLIAGKGPDRALLEREADRLSVAPQVRWLGFVPEEGLPDLYRASDLFVLCTREDETAQEVEGFGLVFLEAQACGTPVVGTRTGGIPDAVKDGEGGRLIAQDDHEALAGILARLAESPEEFEAQGRAGRARVEREFTWDRYMERFVAELSARGIELG